MSTFNILDLFSGTGGFSYGFTSYSKEFKVVGAIDILKWAALTTKANHKEAFVVNDDIRNIRPSDIEKKLPKNNPKIDVIIGGPPCQGFSSIRPFRSSENDDPRNSLFEQYALFVNYFRPKVFVMENVVGLVTYNNGKTLEVIQECFEDMGYETDWKILNAANFGVPQKRERFILIGVQKGYSIKFPEATNSFAGKTIGYKDKSRMVLATEELPPALTVMDAIGDLPSLNSGEHSDVYTKDPINDYQRQRRNNLDILTLHKATQHPPKMLEIIKHAGDNINCIPKHLITSGFSTCYSRLRAEEPSSTITVKFVNPASNKCIHPFQDRALTPREGARLQSFDDDYIFCGSRVQIVTQIGNAVPPLLGQAIAKSVLSILKQDVLLNSH